jgi:hypothetical protein
MGGRWEALYLPFSFPHTALQPLTATASAGMPILVAQPVAVTVRINAYLVRINAYLQKT